VFGVQQAKQCPITQPLARANSGKGDYHDVIVIAIAARVRELHGRGHVPEGEGHIGLGSGDRQ
jgi:hypothetical protein